MKMEFQDIIYEKKDRVAKIIINRRQVMNALTARTLNELIEAFLDVAGDRSIGVVVLTGSGDRAFSSGGDVKWELARARGEIKETTPILDIHNVIRTCPKPTIAAVKGYAIGAGNVMAALCDLTIAADNAIFGQTGPRVGSFNAWGSGYLARVIGQKKARELWFLCRQYTAPQALEMGLVNAVVPLDKLDEEVDKWCKEILTLSPFALRALKLYFNADTEHFAADWNIAVQELEMYQESAEAKEGMAAFLEKRKPDFWKATEGKTA